MMGVLKMMAALLLVQTVGGSLAANSGPAGCLRAAVADIAVNGGVHRPLGGGGGAPASPMPLSCSSSASSLPAAPRGEGRPKHHKLHRVGTVRSELSENALVPLCDHEDEEEGLQQEGEGGGGMVLGARPRMRPESYPSCGTADNYVAQRVRAKVPLRRGMGRGGIIDPCKVYVKASLYGGISCFAETA
uniref:Uncharacterized protein n=1 Tax=Hemiselmis andersenii TaxID=464988 RepID=A0A7S0Y145_HEMAN|mmetsp:Transcript_36509/g.85241  ORF Transcript_36509/g.85241 Transcript_36509/m.85241 type:complete len:189 (+) Transcript_36509:22-588(+)